MKRFLGILFLFLCFEIQTVALAAADEAPSFAEANTNYRIGDFAKAQQGYEALIQQDPQVAEFYYNLGNTYVRLEKMSQAILNYEKALRLDPRNDDIRHNLNYARSRLEYRVEDTRNWYLRLTEEILKYLTEKEINGTFLVILCIFLLGGILSFLSGRGIFWHPWQQFVFIVLLCIGLVAFGKQIQSNVLRDAIVMQKECEARYGPSEHDQVAFRMGEGLKVFVMDRREDWSRVLLTNGESGWVKDEAIAEVKI